MSDSDLEDTSPDPDDGPQLHAARIPRQEPSHEGGVPSAQPLSAQLIPVVELVAARVLMERKASGDNERLPRQALACKLNQFGRRLMSFKACNQGRDGVAGSAHRGEGKYGTAVTRGPSVSSACSPKELVRAATQGAARSILFQRLDCRESHEEPHPGAQSRRERSSYGCNRTRPRTWRLPRRCLRPGLLICKR